MRFLRASTFAILAALALLLPGPVSAVTPSTEAAPVSNVPTSGASAASEATVLKSFQGNDLLVGRSVKQPGQTRKFSVGLDMAFAPMNVVLSNQKENIIAQACKGQPATCPQYANQGLDILSKVPDSKWTQVQAAAGDINQLDAALAQAGVSQANITAVNSYVGKMTPQSRSNAVSLARTISNTNASNILFEPWADLNLKWVAIRAGIPFTLTLLPHSTDAALANFNVDVKSGYTWAKGPFAFGLGGGLSMYFPTASSTSSSAAALANMFAAPKFTYQYLSFAPYIVLGCDIPFLTVQAHLEYVGSARVRGSGASPQYLKWGTGLIVAPRFFVQLIGEINGLVPLANARAFTTIYGLGGIQFKLWWIKLSAAVQAPITNRNQSIGSIGGVDVGTLASFSVLGRFSLTF